MLYRAPPPLSLIKDSKGHHHYQYNMIILVKVQVVEQCKMAKKTAKTRPPEQYKIVSSHGTIPSPGVCHSTRKRNWDRSHREANCTSSRVSEDNKEESDNY